MPCGYKVGWSNTSSGSNVKYFLAYKLEMSGEMRIRSINNRESGTHLYLIGFQGREEKLPTD